ncbi:MAG: hypothetical protein AMS23_04295 [Bacteroides sp. SM1_62]|nr:MAG: hypothetical protein AMS23_04295 [Bacteroides sp. SM1_62]
MKRRQFIKYGVGSILTAPLIYHGCSQLYEANYASPIVSLLDRLATSLDYTAGQTINSDGVINDKILSFNIINDRVARMVDTAVMNLTKQSSVGKAWESLFPAGHPNEDTTIGIKLNFSYGDWRNDRENDWSKIYCPFGPKDAVTNAIVTGLTQMLDGTFPIENITLVERVRRRGYRKTFPLIQGYRPVSANSDGIWKDTQPGTFGIHWIDTSNELELPRDAPKFIAAPDYPKEYRAPQRIFAGIYNNDFLINYAIAKDHRAAGITGAMKNNYGCADNPMGTHGMAWTDENSPYAGTRLCVPVFYKNVDKQVPYILNIMDALTGVYEGGPLFGKVFHANTIAMSKDPVAIDAYLLNLINRVREDKGLSIMSTDDGKNQDGHKNASFLRIAAENHGLGSMSLDDLQSYDLSSGSEQSNIPVLQNSQSRISEVRRTKDRYQMQVFLDNSKRKHTIESRIEDMDGKVVRHLKSQSTILSNALLEWDHRNNNKISAKEGIYTWYISVDGILHTNTINDKANA